MMLFIGILVTIAFVAIEYFGYQAYKHHHTVKNQLERYELNEQFAKLSDKLKHEKLEIASLRSSKKE